MTDTDRYIRRGVEPPVTGGTVVAVAPDGEPGSGGWAYTGIEVVVLAPGTARTWYLDGLEALVLPLRSGVRVVVETSPAETSLAAMGHAELGRVEPGRVQMGPAETSPVELHLAGRRDVFAGPTDSAYAPTGSQLSIQADQDVPARIALCTARAARTLPARYIRADETVAEVRGAGTSSRRVTNYTLGTGVPVDHLLVCEVVTPGGNVSSYPPHKHDEHTDVERELEEIYYYEVADGLHGQAGAVAYHRNYAGPGRPLDILAEVRTGDVALVPHGFHGPVVTLPGYDVYYLNVMAGPATDGRWLMVDDPQYHWVRQTWAHQSVDPRLLPPISMSRIET